MQICCPKCGDEIEQDTQAEAQCAKCDHRWTPPYPPATIAMNKYGHLFIWRGFLTQAEYVANRADLVILSSQDVSAILAGIPLSESNDIQDGWTTHTNYFHPEYFEVSRD